MANGSLSSKLRFDAVRLVLRLAEDVKGLCLCAEVCPAMPVHRLRLVSVDRQS